MVINMINSVHLLRAAFVRDTMKVKNKQWFSSHSSSVKIPHMLFLLQVSLTVSQHFTS